MSKFSNRRATSMLRGTHQALLDAARKKAEAEHNDYMLTLLKGESVGSEGLPMASVDSLNLYLGFEDGEVFAKFDSHYRFSHFEDRAGNTIVAV
jgi:hypothetical protein